MKVALLGPIAWRTPLRHYGPWELVTGLLADGLAQRGVDVTLFATLDSITCARLDGVCALPYEEDDEIDGRVWEAPTSRMRSAARPSSISSTTTSTGCRSRSRACAGADGDDDPRVLVTADPAGLPAPRGARS